MMCLISNLFSRLASSFFIIFYELLAITIYFPFATYLKSIFSHLHLTKPIPSHYLHTHLHTYAYHHPYLHLPIPRSPTPLTTLLTIYTYFSLYPSSFIIPIFMHTSPIFILPPNPLLLFYTPMCTSNFTPHLPMATSTTLVMSLNLLSLACTQYPFRYLLHLSYTHNTHLTTFQHSSSTIHFPFTYPVSSHVHAIHAHHPSLPSPSLLMQCAARACLFLTSEPSILCGLCMPW